MKIYRNSVLSGVLLAFATMGSTQATELHYIECGGELFPTSVRVIAEFEAAHPDVTVNTEAVPWETCRDPR